MAPKWLLAVAVSTVVVSGTARSQSLVNPGFEATSAVGCTYNLTNTDFNAAMTGVTAFGLAGEIDLQTTPGCYMAPHEGSWCISLDHNGTDTDAIAMSLTAPLTVGAPYTLTFWANRDTTFSDGDRNLEVGTSSSPTSFGTLVGSVPVPAGTWTAFSFPFTASSADSYVTVRISNTLNGGTSGTWISVDAFNPGALPVELTRFTAE